jgi:hypothetical protein
MSVEPVDAAVSFRLDNDPSQLLIAEIPLLSPF